MLLVACCIGVFLALPSNYYLRRALTHFLPKIDQYPIFENRIVKAGDPSPWQQAKAYNTCSIPDKYLPVFNNLGTVAYVVIQDSTLLFEQYWEDIRQNRTATRFRWQKVLFRWPSDAP